MSKIAHATPVTLGEPALMPEGGTDPWLETQDGEVLNLAPYLERIGRTEGCDCFGGFFAPTDTGPTDQGVERCDECQVYPSDFAAALALADMIGGGVTAWYQAEHETEVF